MEISRRSLLKAAAVGAPVALVGGVAARGFAAPARPVTAATTASDCQSGGDRLIYWGDPHNSNTPGTDCQPYQSLISPVPRNLQSCVTAVPATNAYVFGLKGGRV